MRHKNVDWRECRLVHLAIAQMKAPIEMRCLSKKCSHEKVRNREKLYCQKIDQRCTWQWAKVALHHSPSCKVKPQSKYDLQRKNWHIWKFEKYTNTLGRFWNVVTPGITLVAISGSVKCGKFRYAVAYVLKNLRMSRRETWCVSAQHILVLNNVQKSRKKRKSPKLLDIHDLFLFSTACTSESKKKMVGKSDYLKRTKTATHEMKRGIRYILKVLQHRV